MRYLLIITALLVTADTYGQVVKPGIVLSDVIVEDNRSASRTLSSKTQSMLSKTYKVTATAPLAVSLAATPGKINVINGMDTYAVTMVDLAYTVQLEGRPAATHTTAVRCKGTNESDLMRKIGVSVARDKKVREGVMSFIEDYLAQHLRSCTDVSTLIDKSLATGNIPMAYETTAYYATIAGCEEVAGTAEEKIVAKHGELMCQKTIAQAEILANSGDADKLGKAIDMLLLIPPTATCQDEALRVAQIVNTNALELSKSTGEKIITRVENRRGWTYPEWREYYQRNYSRGY